MSEEEQPLGAIEETFRQPPQEVKDPATSRKAATEGTHLKNDSVVLYCCRPGQKLAACNSFPRPNSSLEALACIGSLLLFFGLFYLLPALEMYAIYALCTDERRALGASLLTILVALAFLPSGQTWVAYRNWWLWDTWRRYFRHRIITPPVPYIQGSEHMLVVNLPHATFPMGGWLTAGLVGNATVGLPAPTSGAVASILLWIPLIKHLMAFLGCFEASEPEMLRLLKTSSLSMFPEGVAGIFEGATATRERIYIRKRRGFIRIAIKAGADLLPIYHFGVSQILSYKGSSSLSRRIRMTVGIFYGAWGLPLPRKYPVITAVGAPVHVTQNDHPSKEEIDETHARFVTAIQELFDQHKQHLGWEGKRLEIV